jgi:hypothetical protein
MSREGIADHTVRKETFFYRGRDELDPAQATLGCPECGFIIDHIPEDWLDAHVGESIGCPDCGLSNRIPTPEEANWPDDKSPDDPMFGIPAPERELVRRLTIW